MTFKEMFNNKSLFQYKDMIIEQCGIKESQYYNWCSGITAKIPYLARIRISELLEKSCNELFPEYYPESKELV